MVRFGPCQIDAIWIYSNSNIMTKCHAFKMANQSCIYEKKWSFQKSADLGTFMLNFLVVKKIKTFF